MKYEKPELTVLTAAINAIQTAAKSSHPVFDSLIDQREHVSAYADWES
jgi:hypothetical protein